MKYTKEQRVRIAQKVAELYVSDMYTLESCCEALKVDYDTFRNWAASSVDDFDLLAPAKQKELKRRGFVPEVHIIIKQAKLINDSMYTKLVLDKARAGLLKTVKGFYYTRRDKVIKVDHDGKEKVTGYKLHRKYIPPNIKAIIFVLKSLDPCFKDEPLITQSDTHRDREIIRAMSDDELLAKLLELMTDLGYIPERQ